MAEAGGELEQLGVWMGVEETDGRGGVLGEGGVFGEGVDDGGFLFVPEGD